MKRTLSLVAVCSVMLCLAVSVQGKAKQPKPGKMTGTWECMSHGSSQGDMPFTLYLEQTDDSVTGSISSPIGGTEITSATFKKNKLDIRLETSNGTYVLSAKLKKGQLIGEWSHEGGESGTWEGKRHAEADK
jgi:hypothetical protein